MQLFVAQSRQSIADATQQKFMNHILFRIQIASWQQNKICIDKGSGLHYTKSL